MKIHISLRDALRVGMFLTTEINAAMSGKVFDTASDYLNGYHADFELFDAVRRHPWTLEVGGNNE